VAPVAPVAPFSPSPIFVKTFISNGYLGESVPMPTHPFESIVIEGMDSFALRRSFDR
jgi:hypothetical protein